MLPSTFEIPSESQANEWYNRPQIEWFARKNTAPESPGDALRSGVPKEQAAAYLDQFQQATFSALMDQYGDATFAQVLALKLANLAAARYHLANRHSVLFSHPVVLRVDPSNACQLACPGCVHSENNVHAGVFDWPSTTLSVDTHDAWLTRLGPFAFCAVLFNYGEPLLNKRFAEIVRRSKEYLLYTMTSTNLSLPVNNEDAIVAEPAGALSIAALDDYADQIKGKNVVCIISGGNNDIDRMQEIKERSLQFEGLKHYFLISFAQRPGALKQFVNDVLGPDDDIARFEYMKKNNKESGPALVGIELSDKKDYDSLIQKLNLYNINYTELKKDDEAFGYLV